MPSITYDPKIKVLNIKLSSGKIVDSDVQKCCVLDYDRNGDVVNIEVLDVDLEKLLR